MKKISVYTAAAVSAGLLLCLCTSTVSPSKKNMHKAHSEVLAGDIWLPDAMAIVEDINVDVRAEGTVEPVSQRPSILTISTGLSDMKLQKASWERADSASEYRCAGTDIALFHKSGEKSWNRAEEFIAFIENDGRWSCVRVFQPVGLKDCSLQNFAQVVADVQGLTLKH
jgi:hypothetical protein